MRDLELREILTPRENAGRETVRLFLAAHDVTDVENRTHILLTCMDGLVFDRLVSGGEVPREALEGLIAAALREDPGIHSPARNGLLRHSETISQRSSWPPWPKGRVAHRSLGVGPSPHARFEPAD